MHLEQSLGTRFVTLRILKLIIVIIINMAPSTECIMIKKNVSRITKLQQRSKTKFPKNSFKDNIQLTTNKMLIRLSVTVTVQNMCMKKQQHTTQLSINCEQYIHIYIERERDKDIYIGGLSNITLQTYPLTAKDIYNRFV